MKSEIKEFLKNIGCDEYEENVFDYNNVVFFIFDEDACIEFSNSSMIVTDETTMKCVVDWIAHCYKYEH